VRLSDWLRAADQIQPACSGRPGQPHEARHRGGEVAHLHRLEEREHARLTHMYFKQSFRRGKGGVSYLNGDAGRRDDLLHPDGGALGQRHLPVRGLLRRAAQGQLAPGSPGVTEWTRRQRLAVSDDVVVQRRRHALTHQEEPERTAHVNLVWARTSMCVCETVMCV